MATRLRFSLVLMLATGFGCDAIVTRPAARLPTSADLLVFTCTPEQQAKRGQSFDRLRRLSRTEIINTMAALLGPEVMADAGISGRLHGLPLDSPITAGDFTASPRLGLATTLHQVSTRVGELADASWKSTYLAGCAGMSPATEECAAEVARSFGGKVWRRPLSGAELERYVQSFRLGGGGDVGLILMVRRLLEAPALVFHVEEGLAQTNDGRIRLSDYEVASRISYLAADSMPDATLLDAAAHGELATLAGVRTHAERFLLSAPGRAKLADFFRYYTRLDTVANPPAGAALQAGIASTRGLGEEMRQEAIEFFESVLADGTFSDLMKSTRAFPRSSAMATIFGTQTATDQPVDAPSHPGLLHRPALLVSATARTTPIIRGAHVRKLFLCDQLGLPDPTAVSERQEAVGDLSLMSNREGVSALTSAAQCAGCHTLINGVGFAFEGYDPLGMPRSEERVFDDAGNELYRWPIDTRVSEISLESSGPTALNGSAELVDAIVAGKKAHACLSQRVFEYYRLSAIDTQRDGCTLREAEGEAHDATLRSVFVAAIANEDIFWRKVPE